MSILGVVTLLDPAALSADAEGRSGGKLRLGYRTVEVTGSETKYREDIDLDEGLRLFELRLDWRADRESRTFADRIELDLSGLGGDPFESFHLSVAKRGRYALRYDRSRSAYFYDDVLRPLERSTPGLSDAGDFHRFDLDRVRDDLRLDLDLGPASKITLGLERVTRRGDGTTTLDIAGDEFVLDQPVDESSNELVVGFEHVWKRATLVVEERYREFENDVESVLPEASLGLDPFDTTQLEAYRWSRPRAFESQEHTIRLDTRPLDSLRIRVSALWQKLDLDIEGTETGRGSAGEPFVVSNGGRGSVDREAELFDIDLTYRIAPRVALVAGLRRHRLDQAGEVPFGEELQAGIWDLRTTGGELGVEANVTSRLTLSAGLRLESRDVEWVEASGDAQEPLRDKTTDHEGWFATLAWRPSTRFQLDAEVEDDTYDDPFSFTVASDRRRYRLRARVKGFAGAYAEGTWVAHRLDNETYDWRSDRDQWTVRVGYRRSGLDVSLGGSAITTERQTDRTIFTVPDWVLFPYPVFYRSDADFLEGRLRYRVSERLQLGAEARAYDHHGDFGIEREDLRGWIEITVGKGFLLGVAYRRVEFDETLESDVTFPDIAFGGEDYGAELIELSIGRRW